MLPICSPDALIQSPKFGHQFCGSFVLVAAQVVHGLYGLWGGLQLIFIDVDTFVLGFNTNRVTSCWRILDSPRPSVLYLLPRFNHAGCVSQDVDVLVFVVLVDLWPRFKQWLHEQIQKGRNSNLEGRYNIPLNGVINRHQYAHFTGAQSSPAPQEVGPYCWTSWIGLWCLRDSGLLWITWPPAPGRLEGKLPLCRAQGLSDWHRDLWSTSKGPNYDQLLDSNYKIWW